MATVGYDGYQRGMLVRDGPRVSPRGYVRGALNLIAVQGRWRSRPGLMPAHGAPFVDGSTPLNIRGLGVHIRSDGSRDYLVAAGASLFRLPLHGDPILLTLGFLPSTQQTRVDPTAGVRFLSLSAADNETFLFDGVNPSLKWDGTKLTKMGLPTPTPPAAPTNNGGAAIGAGKRDYFRTLKTATHESDLSTATTVNKTGGGGDDFASPVGGGVDFDDPQVTKWALYRTQAGGAVRFFVDEADLGLPISDNTTDEVLGAGATAESFVNTPPDTDPFSGKFLALVEHQSLVWGVDAFDRSLVRFSWGTDQYIAPEGWPAERTIPVAHGDGDFIVALVSFFDWLVVFKQLTTWAIQGSLDAGYVVTPVMAANRQGVGCIAPLGIQRTENEIIFPSRDGIYVMQRSSDVGGVQAQKISDAIDGLYDCTNFSLGAAALFDRQKQVYMFFAHG